MPNVKCYTLFRSHWITPVIASTSLENTSRSSGLTTPPITWASSIATTPPAPTRRQTGQSSWSTWPTFTPNWRRSWLRAAEIRTVLRRTSTARGSTGESRTNRRHRQAYRTPTTAAAFPTRTAIQVRLLERLPPPDLSTNRPKRSRAAWSIGANFAKLNLRSTEC